MYILYAGLSLVGVAVIGIILFKMNAPGRFYILGLFAIWLLYGSGIILGFHMGEKRIMMLTKEVQFTQMPLKGNFTTTAQIKIIYQNGELEKIELVPSTTKKAE
jgi:hypothetical protein